MTRHWPWTKNGSILTAKRCDSSNNKKGWTLSEMEKSNLFLCLNISDYLISRFQDEAYEQLHLHATSHCRGEPSVRPRA